MRLRPTCTRMMGREEYGEGKERFGQYSLSVFDPFCKSRLRRECTQNLVIKIPLVPLRRYIVCRGLKPGSDAVREYMFRVNLKLNQLKNTDRDVTDVVPLSIIKEDTDFYRFMVNSNERSVFTKKDL